jgi:hypothetical protein
MANAVLTFNQNHPGADICFLPSKYISSLKDRINVTEVSRKEIQKAMKTADLFAKEVILQDLLLVGRKGETKVERDFQILAVELYLKSSGSLQLDFFTHLQQAKDILKGFSDAMVAHHIYHRLMELVKPGSSGLTAYELQQERVWVLTLEKCKY